MPDGEVSKTKVCFVGGERDKEIQTCSSPLTLAVLVTNLFQAFRWNSVLCWLHKELTAPLDEAAICCLVFHCEVKSYNMSAIANQRAFPYIFLTDLKKMIFHIVILVRYVYFFTMFTCLSHFKGSVSNIWWIIYIITYTSICLQMKVTSLHIVFVISLLCEWKSNRPYPPDGAVFRLEKNVQLNSALNWRALHELFMCRQHCRKFWGWAFDQVNSYTLNVLFFFIWSWKWLSAWAFKCRLNSYSSIIC